MIPRTQNGGFLGNGSRALFVTSEYATLRLGRYWYKEGYETWCIPSTPLGT
jgi:hypothetical protein